MSISQHLHSLCLEERIAALRSCCNNDQWIQAMLKALTGKSSDEDILQLSQTIFLNLPKEEWLATFATHPRIGDPPVDHLKQEFEEQSGFSTSEKSIKTKMSELNRQYYDKFGFIFITCATRKTGEQMLIEIRQRLQSSFSEELKVAALEQCQITALRLKRVVPKSNL